VGDKDFSSLTLSIVDSFCVPVLLYGLEALDNKLTTKNSIDFAYNGVFVKLFNIKEKYNILYCQRDTNCLPARLDMRTLCFYKALMSEEASPLASELFHVCGDSVFDTLRDKYSTSHHAKLHNSLILNSIWCHIDSQLL